MKSEEFASKALKPTWTAAANSSLFTLHSSLLSLHSSLFTFKTSLFTFRLHFSAVFIPSFCRFHQLKPTLSRNKSIGFVEQFHWFRSTIPLISSNDSIGFVSPNCRFCSSRSSFSPLIFSSLVWKSWRWKGTGLSFFSEKKATLPCSIPWSFRIYI